MKLYFAPLACSMATRIALQELNLKADYVEVCPSTKRTLPADEDYLAINPLGLVPALVTNEGAVITENLAVLQYLAEVAGQMPEGPAARAELRQWMAFISTELHKAVFTPFFDRAADDQVRAYALSKSAPRLAVLEARLKEREVLVGGSFSVADAFLVTVLNWAQATPVDLGPYPGCIAYLDRHRTRPSVAAAIALELPLYIEEKRRDRGRAAPGPTPPSAAPSR